MSSNLKALTIVVAALFLRSAFGQEISDGSCPSFPVVKQFDLTKYLGQWYGYSNYFAIFQANGECTSAKYEDITEAGSPPKIRVTNKNKRAGQLVEALGSAVLNNPADPEVPAQLIVNFDSAPPFAKATTTNYNVVDTDYNNYSIVYTCSDKPNNMKSELMWILTRERIPSEDLIKELYQKIEALGLDTGKLKANKQTGCEES